MKRRFNPPEIVFRFKYAPFPSLKLIAILLIFQTLALPFRESSPSDTKTFLLWFAVGGFNSSLVLIFLAVIKPGFLKRFGAQIPIERIYLIGAFTGMCKGALTGYMINIFAIKDSYPWDEILVRAYSATLLGFGVSFGISLLAAYNFEVVQKQKSLSLENDLVAVEIAEVGRGIQLLKEDSKKQIIERVQQDLLPYLSFNKNQIDNNFDWRKLAQTLREKTTEVVRRESHAIRKIPRRSLSVKEILDSVTSFKVLNLHTRVFALIQFSIGATVVYEDWNPRNSLINLAAHTILTLLITHFFSQGLKRLDPSPRINLIFFCLIIILHSITYSLTDLLLWNRYSFFFQISTLFWHIFLLLSISFLSEIIQSRNELMLLEQEVAIDLQDKRKIMTDHFTLLTEEMSKYLHGFLINKIHFTASKLESQASNQEFDLSIETLDELLEEFSFESLMKGFEGDELDEDFIKTLSSTWEGLINITAHLSSETLSEFLNTQKIELGHVVEELVSNAFRHGKADQIKIEFSRLDERTLEIRAHDNGVGSPNSREVGLGSLLFARASDGNWSMNNSPEGGFVVSLTVGLYEKEAEVPFLTPGE